MSEEKLSSEQNIQSQLNYSNTLDNKKTLLAQHDTEKTCSCQTEMTKENNTGGPQFVYALGQIQSESPNKGIEYEMNRLKKRLEENLKGLTPPEEKKKLFTMQDARYLAREMCWRFEIEKLPVYLLVPRYSDMVDKFIDVMRPEPANDDIDLIIGTLGPVKQCGSLTLPIVIVDHVYSFDKNELMNDLMRTTGKKESKKEDQFNNTSQYLFRYLSQLADNVGVSERDRALNWLSVTYAPLYTKTQEMQDQNYTLTSVDSSLSKLSNTGRKIIQVIFTYEPRTGGAPKRFACIVDITDKYPFISKEPERPGDIDEYFIQHTI